MSGLMAIGSTIVWQQYLDGALGEHKDPRSVLAVAIRCHAELEFVALHTKSRMRGQLARHSAMKGRTKAKLCLAGRTSSLK
jgi:hypothetical protein